MTKFLQYINRGGLHLGFVFPSMIDIYRGKFCFIAIVQLCCLGGQEATYKENMFIRLRTCLVCK